MSDPQQTQPDAAQPSQVGESVTIDVSQSSPSGNQAASQPPSSRLGETMNRVSRSLLERPINYDPISILFTLAVLIAGIVGFATKGSIPSIVSGSITAVLLAIGVYIEGSRKNAYPFVIVTVVFGAFMFYRYLGTYNFWPSGVFAILSVVMVARHAYLIYLRRQTAP